jgi:tetratricopeptide (TPR) repeat protein
VTETSRIHAAAHLAAAKANHKNDDIPAMREALDQLGRAPDRTAVLLLEAAKMYAAAGAANDAVRSYLEAGTAFIDPEAELGRAREAFEAAHALDPVNLDVIFQIGRVYMIEGDAQKALAQFVHVLRHSKYTHAPALFEAACVYEQLGLHDQAILTFRKVLDRDRTNVPAIVRMGQRLHSMGMLPEAIGYYVQAAEAAYAAGQIGTCRHVINVVLGQDPNNHRARSVMQDLNDMLATPKHESEKVDRVASRVAEAPPPAPMPAASADDSDVASKPSESAPPVEYATRMDVARLAAKYDRHKSKLDELSAAVAAIEEILARLEIAAEAPVSIKAAPPREAPPPPKSTAPPKTAAQAKKAPPKPRKRKT